MAETHCLKTSLHFPFIYSGICFASLMPLKMPTQLYEVVVSLNPCHESNFNKNK